ncbi:MAG TPA: DNA topoisomerase, partial [Candidatus Scatomonas merdavium]|nr:DNA topoisomerase [Candidatus Scatomonas merdavium]
KGTPADNLCNYSSEKEQIIYVGSMAELKTGKLVFATRAGMVKIVDGSEFDVAKRTIAATKLSGEEDRLLLVGPAEPNDYLVLKSAGGYFLRFSLDEVPEKKKTAIGVRGIRLGEEDAVEDAWLLASRIEFSIPYHDRELTLNKLKLGKRDGRGTKIRG